MANKKITDLQLRSAVTDDLNFPSDDGIQSYRVTGSQFKEYILPLNAIATDRIQDEAVTLAKIAAAVRQYLLPIGSIVPYVAAIQPTGFLSCNGQAVSRTTYAGLFAVIGTGYGAGDGSTTFNVPDFRGMFLRGAMPNLTASGSGSASGNNAVFTAHPFTRTGMKVRLAAGTLSGLAASTDYYVIVIDANTLAFATTPANAYAGTKIAISGTNTASIVQYVDPDTATRIASAPGGSTGSNPGSFQDHQVISHNHSYTALTANGTDNPGYAMWASDASSTGSATGQFTYYGGNETRPANVSVQYLIKV